MGRRTIGGWAPVVILASAVAADTPPSCQTPIFADWSLLMLPYQSGIPCVDQPMLQYTGCADYTYIPHPGGAHGYSATHQYTACLYDELTAAGAPRGVMIRARNCPFPYNVGPYTPAPTTIDDVLVLVPDMEFVFMDLEGHTIDEVEPNMLEVIARARSVNPNVRIGNYAYYPGVYDGSRPFESQADRTSDFFGADLNAIYLESGLDIAQPNCYPYEYYVQHTAANQYGGTSPTARSALFWAPLERYSVAKRALPEGHLMIPWIAPFISWDGYEAPEPPTEDIAALTQHVRLRGADAFYSFSPGASGHPMFTNETYREFALTSWVALDRFFVNEPPATVLNLETDKTSGVEWSGVMTSTRVVVLASNLGTSPSAEIALPPIRGVPATVTVPVDTHELFVFTLPTCTTDFNGDGVSDISDLLAFLSLWFQRTAVIFQPFQGADFDGSGRVDINDLLAFLAAWFLEEGCA